MGELRLLEGKLLITLFITVAYLTGSNKLMKTEQCVNTSLKQL